MATLAASEARTQPWPIGVVLRDIAAGGIAGIVAGIVVAGVGGRIAMRLAALLVPDAVGLGTANGNRIGEITVEGTAALIVFEGLFVGMSGAVIWVTIRPWMPAPVLARLLVAMVASVAVGSLVIIDGTNPDFRILEFSPLVVGMFVLLVALFGAGVGLVEWLLDRHLPVVGETSRAMVAYGLLAVAGLTLALPLALQGVFGGPLRPIGATLAVCGLATLAWWWLRARGATVPPRALTLVGRGGVVASIATGLWIAAPEILATLGG